MFYSGRTAFDERCVIGAVRNCKSTDKSLDLVQKHDNRVMQIVLVDDSKRYHNHHSSNTNDKSNSVLRQLKPNSRTISRVESGK